MDGIVILPRLHADDGAGEVGEVVQRARHRTEDALDALLARHAGVDADLGPPPRAAAQRVDAAPGGGHAD